MSSRRRGKDTHELFEWFEGSAAVEFDGGHVRNALEKRKERVE